MPYRARSPVPRFSAVHARVPFPPFRRRRPRGTVAGRPVLAAHKTEPLAYFGWHRMSMATDGGHVFTLLVQAANGAFRGS